jgi:hypothetical protein
VRAIPTAKRKDYFEEPRAVAFRSSVVAASASPCNRVTDRIAGPRTLMSGDELGFGSRSRVVSHRVSHQIDRDNTIAPGPLRATS